MIVHFDLVYMLDTQDIIRKYVRIYNILRAYFFIEY